LYVGVTLAWAGSILASSVLHPPEWVHAVALVLHLASLIVGFGSILLIEWHGLLWATEWRALHDLRQFDATVRIPVWGGVAGLLVSGALLSPDLHDPLTVVKLWAVLVLSLNGVAVTRWTAELARLPMKARYRTLPTEMRWRLITATVMSQLAWWTAILIGMFNHAAR
jgi:hypothetical protein